MLKKHHMDTMLSMPVKQCYQIELWDDEMLY